MDFPKFIELSQGKNYYFPESHYWVPDFSDFSLPRKKDGGPYDDPENFEAYLNWLVVHLESTDLPLNPHHQEILCSLNIQDQKAGLLGLWLAEAAISEYYLFVDPRFDYPEDFLLDPRPERVCEPASVKFNDTGISEDGRELVPGMIKLQTYLIFDFMC
ncbi:MAG: hypothetical protein HY787_11640 [Deltaproteobacteria bacterium]|nr:hypothetical protein [Deltaproteobacteria bacterium]